MDKETGEQLNVGLHSFFWSSLMAGLLNKWYLPELCPSALQCCWPSVFNRLLTVYSLIDSGYELVTSTCTLFLRVSNCMFLSCVVLFWPCIYSCTNKTLNFYWQTLPFVNLESKGKWINSKRIGYSQRTYRYLRCVLWCLMLLDVSYSRFMSGLINQSPPSFFECLPCFLAMDYVAYQQLLEELLEISAIYWHAVFLLITVLLE